MWYILGLAPGWQVPEGTYKNGELSRMLYEEAFKPAQLFESIGAVKPMTRRQRWAYRASDYWSRIVRAARILAGRDDYGD